MLSEDKFAPVKITSWERRNVRKHTETNNGKHYVALGISLKLDCLDKKEFAYSESMDYVGR